MGVVVVKKNSKLSLRETFGWLFFSNLVTENPLN